MQSCTGCYGRRLVFFHQAHGIPSGRTFRRAAAPAPAAPPAPITPDPLRTSWIRPATPPRPTRLADVVLVFALFLACAGCQLLALFVLEHSDPAATAAYEVAR